LTRMPVRCAESGLVRKSVGNGPVAGDAGLNRTVVAAVETSGARRRNKILGFKPR
jgi:hypothetical protein